MSARTSARVLFGALLLMWPLPMLGLDGSMIPVARFAQLATALTWLAFVEGTGGMVGLFVGLLWGHVVVGTLLLYGVTWLVRRFGLDRLSTASRLGLVSVVVVGLLLWAILGSPYDTQFHHTDAHASLLEMFR